MTAALLYNTFLIYARYGFLFWFDPITFVTLAQQTAKYNFIFRLRYECNTKPGILSTPNLTTVFIGIFGLCIACYLKST